jgi:hypothetical protein
VQVNFVFLCHYIFFIFYLFIFLLTQFLLVPDSVCQIYVIPNFLYFAFQFICPTLNLQITLHYFEQFLTKFWVSMCNKCNQSFTVILNIFPLLPCFPDFNSAPSLLNIWAYLICLCNLSWVVLCHVLIFCMMIYRYII